MDSKTYNAITGFCTKFLARSLQDRHLEDLVQYVAMKHFESKGKKIWQWSCCDYCRDNGLNINSYSRLGAKALENSLSIDAPGANEDSENSLYLLDRESILRSEQAEQSIYQQDSLRGALEVFLSPLDLNLEVLKWVTKSHKVKMG